MRAIFSLKKGFKLSPDNLIIHTADHLTCYRISKTSVSRIIKETAGALRKILSEKRFTKAPSSKEEWVEIENHFERKRYFGNCISAIDGKHVLMQAPARSGSYFFNYKKRHSVVLMAAVKSNCLFYMVDICDTDTKIMVEYSQQVILDEL